MFQVHRAPQSLTVKSKFGDNDNDFQTCSGNGNFNLFL